MIQEEQAIEKIDSTKIYEQRKSTDGRDFIIL